MRPIHRRLVKLCGVMAALTCIPLQVSATQYSLPSSGNNLIGDVTYTSGYGNTIASIGQQYDVGVVALLNANPGAQGPTGSAPSTVKVPAEHILPPLPHRGIVINLAEMRMYYYPDNGSVMTFPVGIGKVGKTIPMGNTAITRKVVNPTWIPPKDIREFNEQQGIQLPYAMGPGPDNPLGPYAIYLRVPTFLIHSTIFPESIGTRASFGCIRMHEGDIKQFFPLVQPGTPVAIVNIPSKVGWSGNNLYLETHPPLEEHGSDGVNSIVSSIQNSTPRGSVTMVDWQLVSYLSEQRDGVPHDIGFRVR